MPASSTMESEEVAIIGMACRFPQADSVEELWKFIESGKVAVSRLSPERFDPTNSSRQPQLQTYWGNYLLDPGLFDYRFFNLSGREAKFMDPQQRIALEVAYEAVESSGYCSIPTDKRELDFGCYVGVGPVEYEHNVAPEDANAFCITGSFKAFISGRISHFFGWVGPSMTLDTACSSSGVAIHTACKAILAGDCSIALAGGVNVMTSPFHHQNFAAASFLNHNGPSRAFDQSSDGYSRGEGCAFFVLKPLSRALADGDLIQGVISASAVRQTSNITSLTQSDALSQASLYKKVLAMAGMSPRDVTFIETHGTGTPVGDPVEYQGIASVFADPLREVNLFLGAIKDNIGHAEAASGGAGILKCLLMMKRKTIVKQASFSVMNPSIKPDPSVTIPRENTPWTCEKRIAIVNNFGASGSLVSLVIREHDATSEPSAPTAGNTIPGPATFLFSARSEASLREYLLILRSEIFHHQGALRDLEFNILHRSNPSFEFRAAFVASDVAELCSRLDCAGSTSMIKKPRKRPVILCFGGQTGRVVRLSKALFDSCKMLRLNLELCNSVCLDLSAPSIFPAIFQGDAIEDLVLLHCALFSLQYATAMSWLDCGLEVDTLIGHSFGQLTALCVAGSISIRDSLRLVSGRARLLKDNLTADCGLMISAEGALEEVESLVNTINSEHDGQGVDFACYNGPTSFVIAGTSLAVAKLEEICRADNTVAKVRTTRLKNTHAYHSHLVDGILDGLTDLARSIEIKEPQTSIEACTSEPGSWTFTPENVSQHSRLPVHFFNAVSRVAQKFESAVWLEAGSASPVIAMSRRILATIRPSENLLIPINLGTSSAVGNLGDALCQLWNGGHSVRPWHFDHRDARQHKMANVPSYRFQRSSLWIEYRGDRGGLNSQAMTTQRQAEGIITLTSKSHNAATFVVSTSNPDFFLRVRGHVVHGSPLCPVSLYIELAVCGGFDLSANDTSTRLPRVENLNISRPLNLASDREVFLDFEQGPLQDDWSFIIRSTAGDSHQQEHARGRLKLVSTSDAFTACQLQSLEKVARFSHCARVQASHRATSLGGSMVYKVFGGFVRYEPYYQGVESVCGVDSEAVGRVKAIGLGGSSISLGISDPTSLDNFFQVASIHVNCLLDRDRETVFISTAVDEILCSAKYMKDKSPGRSWIVFCKTSQHRDDRILSDVFAYDERTKNLVVAIIGICFRQLPMNTTSGQKGSWCHERAPRQDTVITPRQRGDGTIRRSPLIGNDPHHPNGDVFTPEVPAPSAAGPTAGAERLGASCELDRQVRQILTDIIGINYDEIAHDAGLGSLGVDSLLVTEVLRAFRVQLQVDMTAADFQACQDVSAICGLVKSRVRPKTEYRDNSASDQHGQDACTPGLSTPQTSVVQPANKKLYTDSGPNFAIEGRACFNKVKGDYRKYARETGFWGFCSNVFPSLLDLVVTYIAEALESSNINMRHLEANEHVPEIPHIPKHRKLVRQLYTILELAGVVRLENGIFLRTARGLPSSHSSSLSDEILSKFPQHGVEMKLLRSTAARLAECLSGKEDALSILFGSTSARTLLETFYTDAPMFKAASTLLATYIRSLLCCNSARDSPVRILEIGAGTGGTTKEVVDMVMDTFDTKRLSYTFTDVSPSLVGAARRKFSHYPFVDYAVLDIEEDPSVNHTALLNRFDIVISTNCVHATRDLVTSGRHICQLLKPHGIMCLIELTRNLYWLDLVFGFLDGWWLASDGRKHPLAHESLWDRELRSAGFQWVDWSTDLSRESDMLKLIVASPSRTQSADTYNHDHHSSPLVTQEAVPFKEVDDIVLYADLHYPPRTFEAGKAAPVALMIHGGGHVMRTRKDIRMDQVALLVRQGFVVASIDYRLCPEVSLAQGPMADVTDAFFWTRKTLPEVR
ncbi:hypothetical protein CEP53_015111, partial [Fusarium sp. AF-6]